MDHALNPSFFLLRDFIFHRAKQCLKTPSPEVVVLINDRDNQSIAGQDKFRVVIEVELRLL